MLAAIWLSPARCWASSSARFAWVISGICPSITPAASLLLISSSIFFTALVSSGILVFRSALRFGSFSKLATFFFASSRFNLAVTRFCSAWVSVISGAAWGAAASACPARSSLNFAKLAGISLRAWLYCRPFDSNSTADFSWAIALS